MKLLSWKSPPVVGEIEKIIMRNENRGRGMKEGWKYVKLSEISSIFAGGDVDKSRTQKNRTDEFCYPVYTNGVIDEGLYGYTDIAKVKEPALTISARGTIGAVFVRNEAFYPAIRLITIVPICEVLIKYLYYVLISFPVEKAGTTIPQLTVPMLKNYTFPLPPLSEQQSIVAHLDASFAEIDALKAKAAEEVANAKAMFDAALREEMTPKEGWERYKLGDLYDVRDGTHDSPKYQEKGYPLVTSKNLKGSYIDMNNVKYITEKDYLQINERSKVDYGDVLFAMIGTIGNATLVEEEPRYAIKNMALFKTKSIEEGRFLKLLLDCSIVLDEMHKKSKGTTQQFVSLGYLRSFIVSIPSKAEQGVILDRIDTLRSHLTELEQKYNHIAANCDALKQAILRETFE